MILHVAVFDTVSTSALSMSHEIHSLQVCQHYEWPSRISSQEHASTSALNQVCLCVWKMVCERWCVKDWCVTKLCEWDGVWKMVCDKVVWVRRCAKDGVWQSLKDGVWQSCASEMVCERWCVAKLGVKVGVTKLCEWDGVWKMVCD